MFENIKMDPINSGNNPEGKAVFKTGGGEGAARGPMEDLTGLGLEVERETSNVDNLESLRRELLPVLDRVIEGVAKDLYMKGYKHVPMNKLPEDAVKALEEAIEIKLLEFLGDDAQVQEGVVN